MQALTRRHVRWLARAAWLVGILAFCIIWPVIEFPHFDVPPQSRFKAFAELALLHGSWLLWPLLAQLALTAWQRARERRRWRAGGAMALAIACGLLCYARFVEPNELQVHHTRIPAPFDLDIALVSDIHVGLYTRPAKLRQLVRKLNSMHVDLVLFAGDLTYDPPHDLAAALAPLRNLRQPMYAVLGNHDVQRPGPALAHKIQRVLAGSPVHFIAHRVVRFPDFRLAGLYDWSSGRDYAAFLRHASPHATPLLVLMHEPRSLAALHGVHFALAVAGHTHGGQVSLPWLTDALLRLLRQERYVAGYYRTPAGKLFVTTGVGVTGAPFRFNCPPVIDVLELRRDVH